MREFKRVSLDGKGNELYIKMDVKGSDINALDGKGDLGFWFKSSPGEGGVKDVPANFYEKPKPTYPESLFASDRAPTKKSDKFTWKVSERRFKLDDKYDIPEARRSPDEFTWKWSEHGFKSNPERAPKDLKSEITTKPTTEKVTEKWPPKRVRYKPQTDLL
jgi:hypothetical protein